MANAPLNSVKDYIDDVRTLLLDKTQPYRYEDTELLVALNTALLEARRLRPDLFVTRYGAEVPSYRAVTGDQVCIEPQFRLGFVFGVCAHALLRDDEDVQDERANTFLMRFYSVLVGGQMAKVQGGTPNAKQKPQG